MAIIIPSGRKEFQGFELFYQDEIAPYLRAKESARQRAVIEFAVIIVVAAAIAGALWSFKPFGESSMQIGFAGGILGLTGGLTRLNITRRKIALGLLDKICAKLGFQYRLEMTRPRYGDDFDKLGLLPNYNRETWEDEVRGSRDNADFTMCEANLKYRSSGKNRSTRTVFRGQLLVIDYRKEFLGETVIKRDAGVFNRLMKPGKGFERVGLASSKFEKIFEAWSTDQVEARDLLDPLVLERFEELDRLFDGAKLRAGFSAGNLYVAMETGDKLNMGSMFKPLDSPTRVSDILKTFDFIFDLIDVLIKPASGRIDGAFSVDSVKSG